MNITNTFEYKPTLQEIADEIWKLDSDEQLKLLSLLSEISDSYHIGMQMEYMRDNTDRFKTETNKKAKKFINELNTYLNEEY